jgi:spore coat protein A
MITRRQLLKRGAIGSAVLAGAGAPVVHGLLGVPVEAEPGKHRPNLRMWVGALPTPGASWPVVDLRTTPAAIINAKQLLVSVHPDLPPTTVWGYELDGSTAARSTYLGPTLVAERGTPVAVTFDNQLPTAPLFRADPALVPPGAVDCRINTHLHGGRVADTEDGNPLDAWGDLSTGKPEAPPGSSQTQHYPNEQGGALLWYHDHALGITRTNVYAGLAGGYLLTEPPGSPHAPANVPTAFDLSDVPDPYVPGGKIPLHIPLVIQDKILDAAGRLVYPDRWSPEFFGDTCLVNGRAFPYLDVQPRKYRFTFLNGSQSRFYNLVVNKTVPITQIGVELGPLDSPQPLKSILLAPAERVDVIIDFSGLAIGTKVVVIDTVLPAGVVSPTRPLGDCMQIRVVGPALTDPDPFAGAAVLPGWSTASPTPRPGTPTTSSKVTLEEVLGRGGKPEMAVVNGTPFMERDEDGAMTHAPTEPFSTEIVTNGSTVEWLYLNLTADSHPFHTHLAHVEVMGRQPFDAFGYAEALAEAREAAGDERLDPAEYPDPGPFTLGPEVPAPATEQGPKDTVIANPNEITRVRLRIDLPTTASGSEHHYVFHCHILEHEENEMMRPLLVIQ